MWNTEDAHVIAMMARPVDPVVDETMPVAPMAEHADNPLDHQASAVLVPPDDDEHQSGRVMLTSHPPPPVYCASVVPRQTELAQAQCGDAFRLVYNSDVIR